MDSGAPQSGWDNLASHLRRRLEELDLTQAEIQDLGGPSPAKIREILNRRATTLSPSKRRDLERAVQWTQKSVDVVLAGGKPTVSTGPPPKPAELLPQISDLATEALKGLPVGSPARPHLATAIAEIESALLEVSRPKSSSTSPRARSSR